MKIASKLPKTCQTIMFSATMPKEIEKMAQNLLKDPVKIKLAVSKPAEKIKQSADICFETQKIDIIKKFSKLAT
jgi:superfamily II DNA/RNA helicase